MATFNFRIKKPNTFGYKLLAVPRANSITANGQSFNSVVGRIFNEDPNKSVGTLTVAWKKARTRHALFSGREEASGQVVTDENGFFTIASIPSSTDTGTWLMSFEALVEGRLIGDIIFWNEVSDLTRGTENSEGLPDPAPVTDSDLADYADLQYEVYTYEENATPTTSKPHPWLPPPWYAISPEDQHHLDTDFNLAGYIGDREYSVKRILGRASAAYSPRFIEPLTGLLYDTTGNGNNLDSGSLPKISKHDGTSSLWYPGPASNHCMVTPPATRNGDIVLRATFELLDYTSNQVLVDDHDGVSGVKITLLASGVVSIDLESSTYQSTNPNLTDGNKYTFEIETNRLGGQLILNIYDRNHYLIFRELLEITETSIGSSGGDVYVGAQRDNTLHVAGELYDFYYQDESEILSQFNFEREHFPEGISTSSSTDDVGNTVTFVRSSSGHKLTLFDRPGFSNKTDTYFVAQNASALNFGEGSITLIFIVNYWDQPSSTQPIAMKKASVSGVSDAGYALYISGSGSVYFRSSDGSTQNTRSIPSREGDGLHYIAVIGDRNTDTITLFDGTSQDSASWGVGSIDVAEEFVLMNDSAFGNGFQGNLVGAALFEEALTETEVEEAARKLGMSI